MTKKQLSTLLVATAPSLEALMPKRLKRAGWWVLAVAIGLLAVTLSRESTPPEAREVIRFVIFLGLALGGLAVVFLFCSARFINLAAWVVRKIKRGRG